MTVEREIGSTRTFNVLQLLQLAVLVWLALAISSRSPFRDESPHERSAATQIESEAIVEQLGRLREDLAAWRQRDAQPAVGRPSAARQVAESAADLDAVVAELRSLKDALLAVASRGRGSAAVPALAMRTADMNRDALRQLNTALEGNEKRAVRELLLLPQAEILRRYGRPSSIGGGGGTLTWFYKWRGKDTIWIRFSDGLVSNADR